MVKMFWLGGYVPIHGHSPLSQNSLSSAKIQIKFENSKEM